MTSYRTETYWEQYQRFFPARFRISAQNAPREEWFAWRGAQIHIDRFPCAGAPLTVIVAHGAGGYGRLFAPIGALIRAAGYEVIAPDLPGYGLSITDRSMVNYEVWIQLLVDLVAHEHHRSGRPVVLFGGSIGGFLAYLVAARSHHVAGVIATTLADPRLPLVKQHFAKNGFVLKWGMPLLPFWARLVGGLRLPIKWFTKMNAMSNNPTLTRLVGEDALGGANWVPISFLHSLFSVTPAIEPEEFEVCPVLLVHPAADRWTGIESSQPFFDRIKGDKNLVLLENCGHFPVEEPGITQLEQAVTTFLQVIADKFLRPEDQQLPDLDS